MNLLPNKRRLMVALVFSASGLGLFHGNANAYDCPAGEFTNFLDVFSNDQNVQKYFVAPTVRALVLKPAGQHRGIEPHVSEVKRGALNFPLIAPTASGKREDIEVYAKDDKHSEVIDMRGGNSHIKRFKFVRQTCWVLAEVEDWSISEKYLSTDKEVDMSRTEKHCYQRAQAYAELAGSEQYQLTAELFEASLDNYLCAAASGNPQASLDAASLSLSGMAPQLESDKVEELLKAAATTLADGAAGLSTFYCYGNNIAASGACQHPDLAEKELLRAASLGSADATNYVGYVFEKGLLVTQDVSRAVACYQLAADRGNQIATANVQRLKSQSSAGIAASYCY